MKQDQNKKKVIHILWITLKLAGETRIEHATYGFGDRHSAS